MRQYTNNLFSFDPQSLISITDYLRATGWKRVKYQNPRLAVYTKELGAVGDTAVVALPARVTYSDFATRMEQAVERLAEVEETSPDDMYQRIQAVRLDDLRFRLAFADERAAPSLEATASFLQGVRDLVAYAACMEQEVRPYFTQPFKIGRAETELYQFDQTFHGSFGFSIKSPLPTVEELSLPATDSPLHYARKVVERITRGLRSVQTARETDRPEAISDDFKTGLNGNMCKAVLEMLEEIPNIPLEYSVRWSVAQEPAEDVRQTKPIVLDKDIVYLLRSAADTLEAAQPDAEPNKTIEGAIVGLNSGNEAEHEVIVQAEGYGRVSFELEAGDYARACNAHRDHRTVIVTGTLQQNSNNRWTLLSPSSFQEKE